MIVKSGFRSNTNKRIDRLNIYIYINISADYAIICYVTLAIILSQIHSKNHK
jgi:hypothetical protein